MHAAEIKKGQHFEYQNNIWRVTKKEVVAVGTHSHTKIKIYAKPMEGGGEKNFIFAHQDKIEYLEITRKTAQVISKTPDAVQIMDNVSFETFDAKCEKGLLDEINEGDAVIFVDVKGITQILEKG